MNTTIFRIAALLIHALVNIAIVVFLTGYDITGSWFRVIGFIIILFVLLVLFIRHIFSFIQFLKTSST